MTAILTTPALAELHRQGVRGHERVRREWAYATTYGSSQQRREAVPDWLAYYNTQRPHGALAHKPPATALTAA